MEREIRKGDYVRVANEEHTKFNNWGHVEKIAAMDAKEDSVIQVKLNDGTYAVALRKELELVVEREDRPAELKKFRADDPMWVARKLVQRLHYPETSTNDIYVVWFCKALQNWKALVSTNVKDNAYYEVTHNGNKGETYIDQYIKSESHVVRDEMLKDTNYFM